MAKPRTLFHTPEPLAPQVFLVGPFQLMDLYDPRQPTQGSKVALGPLCMDQCEVTYWGGKQNQHMHPISASD